MSDEQLRDLERTYLRTRDWADCKRLARALKRAGRGDEIIALYEPLLIVTPRHREDYFDVSYIRPRDKEVLRHVLKAHDGARLLSTLHGDALTRADYETLRVTATTPPRARLPFGTRIERLNRVMRGTFGNHFTLDRVLNA